MPTKREQEKIESRRHTGQALALAARDVSDANHASIELPWRLQRRIARLADAIAHARRQVQAWPVTADERSAAKIDKLNEKIAREVKFDLDITYTN